MSNYFMGQIMMTGFGFAQKNFAQCNGQLMAIQQNQALFALLGTYYGGDGIRTFGLPDLRSRTPIGGGFASFDGSWQPPQTSLGQPGGVENVTLLAGQLPLHSHIATVTSDAGTGAPPRGGPYTLGSSNNTAARIYGAPSALMPLGGGPLTPSGNGAQHPNIQPYEVINFNVALYGQFPSRN